MSTSKLPLAVIKLALALSNLSMALTNGALALTKLSLATIELPLALTKLLLALTKLPLATIKLLLASSELPLATPKLAEYQIIIEMTLFVVFREPTIFPTPKLLKLMPTCVQIPAHFASPFGVFFLKEAIYFFAPNKLAKFPPRLNVLSEQVVFQTTFCYPSASN